jgi:hypothetical protein
MKCIADPRRAAAGGDRQDNPPHNPPPERHPVMTARAWRNLLLIALCALLAFGGTFTCRVDNDSDEFTHHPRTGAHESR